MGSDSTVLGVAGMIIDETYFKEEVLPGLVRSSLQEFFPNDHQDMIITLQDESGERLFESQPFDGKGFEVVVPLSSIFKDMNFKVVMRSSSVEQTAKNVVAVNFSLSVAMTGLLVAGILMALRTASREMKLSRMKSDFVSNVSHELRTPLASMRAFGELLRLGWVDEPQKSREYGEYIENESCRLTHLIDNILDFSKIESAGKEYEFRETDIKELVQETLRSFEVRFGQSEFSVVLDVPHEPLPHAVLDRDAVSQSLVNLIDNAIKYSGESKKILVLLAREEGYITISVTDYGIGIQREEHQRVFDKFYRISTGLVHDVKGSGLGLAIVKHIMDAHRGKIMIKSQPGLGSTFTLCLPADKASSENDLGIHAATTNGDVSLRPARH
jgi:signal transduction histidine kinase